MIDINLLPPEYAPKKLISPLNIAIIGGSFLIIISLLIPSLHPSWGLLAALQDYSYRVADHDRRINDYRRELKDIAELKKTMKLLKERMSLVKELLQEKTTWSDKLMELYDRLPKGSFWIDNLNVEREKASAQAAQRPSRGSPENVVEISKIKVSMSGGATSVDNMSKFVANLEESEIFSDVILNTAKSDSAVEGGASVISFQIEFQILTPGGQ
jgi:Tfp pilus assembly protein PilN